ncbi:MAG TPA: phosphoribosylglycinamide formyltransferase [Candidatus Mailhella excrementigallinarum]|nr:MAG: phosphoribosylglycinamide formyltransferase [Desulfovibrionaceae bacterium]HIV66719.1 phosphoribosylglycinamide formyltransferase [Candidatus Mailhella excrementigallinarum]
MSLKLAILASGSGTNAEAMFKAVERGLLDADIRLVLANRPGAKVLERAERHGLPSVCVDHRAFPDRESFDDAVIRAIRSAGADTVALAGYMRLVTPAFLDAFPDRVLNIHPALLPSFPGVHGTADAHAWGVRLTGCTVHFVSPEMDCGPIIVQACLPVMQDESEDELQHRIHALEHRVYPQALQWLAENRLEIRGRRVFLKPAPAGRTAEVPANVLVWPALEEGF